MSDLVKLQQKVSGHDARDARGNAYKFDYNFFFVSGTLCFMLIRCIINLVITCFAIHSFFFLQVYITFIQSNASFSECEDNYGNFKIALMGFRNIITSQDDLIIFYKISKFVFFPRF